MTAGVHAEAPAAFHLLAKPTGAICNLDCKYCFFLSKEMLYPGSRFRVADALLETDLRQLLESHRAPEVSLAWQGGDPTLMGLDVFKRSVTARSRAGAPRGPGRTIVAFADAVVPEGTLPFSLLSWRNRGHSYLSSGLMYLNATAATAPPASSPTMWIQMLVGGTR